MKIVRMINQVCKLEKEKGYLFYLIRKGHHWASCKSMLLKKGQQTYKNIIGKSLF